MSGETISLRRCRHCHRDLPLDAEHFHRHARHKHGFREICKECRSQVRRSQRRESYGRAEKTLLLRYARNLRSGCETPSHQELHYVLSQYLGGAEGIAEAMNHCYQAAKPGSRQAVAILTTFMKLSTEAESARQRQEEEQRHQMSQLSSEELRERSERLLLELLDRQGWEVVPKGTMARLEHASMGAEGRYCESAIPTEMTEPTVAK